MIDSFDHRVLAVNTGSSSLKAGLYDIGEKEFLVLSVEVRRIGLPESRMRITDASGATLFERQNDISDHEAALHSMFAWLEQHNLHQPLQCVGHRIVHGGSRYNEPRWVTPELVTAIEELAPLIPDHLPQAISAIQFLNRSYPQLQQAVCFDTAFHHRMPRLAQMYALPGHFYDQGLKRFGFHGLSYEYITQELRSLDGALADGRIIVAHLGNGASMTAIRGGVSIDTTMGLSPASGLVMGTRCGDIDPEAILYLIDERKMTPKAVNTLVNHYSGLLGVSGTSADMQDLVEKESADPRAAEAIGLFCYRARKYLGAYVAALGGLDVLVFTGGIGTYSATIRERICSDLDFLGIRLDTAGNAANGSLISDNASRVKVRVIKTNEELMIARHLQKLISQQHQFPTA